MNILAAMESASPPAKNLTASVRQSIATARQLVDYLPFNNLDRTMFMRSRLISPKFTLCVIDLNAAAIVETRDLLAVSKPNAPIVVDINKNKLGKAPGGYCPKVIVIEGSKRHHDIMASGQKRILAWVGEHALSYIYADDKMGSNELQSLLQKALDTQINVGDSSSPLAEPESSSSCCGTKKYAYINEVYPFENYFIFGCDGKKFKQAYSINQKKRTVALSGDPIHVVDSYMEIKASTKFKSHQDFFAEAYTLDVRRIYAAGTGPAGPSGASMSQGSNTVMTPPKNSILGCKACKGMKANGHSCDDGLSAASDNYILAVKAGYRTKKSLLATAPPGHEDQVLKLKKKYGEDSDVPFKIAWSDHNSKGKKGKGSKDEMDALMTMDRATMPRGGSPAAQSPGAGSGPRVAPAAAVRPSSTSTGISRLARPSGGSGSMRSTAKIKKMVTKGKS